MDCRLTIPSLQKPGGLLDGRGALTTLDPVAAFFDFPDDFPRAKDRQRPDFF